MTFPLVRVIGGTWQEMNEKTGVWEDRNPQDWAPPIRFEEKMADYGEPSMVGTDARVEEMTARHLHQNLHKLLDNAGVDASGDLMERVYRLINARDHLREVQGLVRDRANTSDRNVPEDIWTREQEIEARVAEITDWWESHAHEVIDRTAPKAAEYGAADLDLMGKNMEVVFSTQLKGTDRDFQEQFGRYAACAFYLQGKIARIFGALERGVLPNPDSEFDIEVYAVMLDRIRETGRWV